MTFPFVRHPRVALNNVDLITNHTGYTSTSGTVSASSENGTRVAWHAFDGTFADIGADAWQSTGSTGWLVYQFATAKTLTSYVLTGVATNDGANANRAPKTWTFEGSQTGAFGGEQIVLDTQTNASAWTAGETRTFNITNNMSYLYYRLNISVDEGGANLTVAELRLVGH